MKLTNNACYVYSFIVARKHTDRFSIKHLHEYIAIDQLKFFRRRRPPEFLTKSSLCLFQPTGKTNAILELPAKTDLKTEYSCQFHNIPLVRRTQSLRRATSLRLEGLMPFNRSEHQDRYLWFTPEDWRRFVSHTYI